MKWDNICKAPARGRPAPLPTCHCSICVRSEGLPHWGLAHVATKSSSPSSCPFFSTSPSIKALCCHFPFLSHLHSHIQGLTLEPQRLSAFQKLLSHYKEKIKKPPRILHFDFICVLSLWNTHKTTPWPVLSYFIGEFQCLDSLHLLYVEFPWPGNEPVSSKWKQKNSSLFCSCCFTE